MIDRYTKTVLTLIAGALVYLCVIHTPLPGVQAQGTLRPGEPTGPLPVVIVGWRGGPGETVPVSALAPVPMSLTGPIQVAGPVQVSGRVTAEKATGDRAERVVVIGWEEGGTRERVANPMQPITAASGLPVNVKR